MAPRLADSFLESFARLGDDANAATSLLHRLLHEAERPEAEDELEYSLRRLVRGTASNRRTAREGYFSALTILLKLNPNVGFRRVFDVLGKELQIGGQSKSEVGDICVGNVLVCGSVIRSGLFTRCSDEEKAELISTLFNASSKRTYLNLTAYYFIADFIKSYSEQDVITHMWPHVKQKFSCAIEEYTLDSLYCALSFNERCPAKFKKLLKKSSSVDSIFLDSAAPKISGKIMNISEFAYINHPIYEAFGKALANSDHLITFWTNELEIKINLHNENRVLIILTIFGSILKHIGSNYHQIPDLLGEKFIPCILEWFKGFQYAKQSGKAKKNKGKQKHYEHESKGKQIVIKANEVFNILMSTMKKDGVDSEIKFRVLEKLLLSPGDIMFCDITNTRIIKILIAELNIDFVHKFADILKKIITNESKKQQIDAPERFWTNSERLRAAEMFTTLINHKSTTDDIKWRIKNMQFLIRISVFKKTGCDDSYISSELAGAVKKCFFKCLTFRLSKLETLLKVLNSLLKFINNNISHQENVALFQPEIINSLKSVNDFLQLLNKSEEDQSKAYTVFKILTLYCGLFLFSDIMNVETVRNSLQDIASCYDHFLEERKCKGSKSEKEVQEGDIVEDEPEWIEVLVDIFISFLSRDSSLLRNVVQCVFRLLCDYLTPSSIEQILSVLDPDDDTNILSYRDYKKNESSEVSNDISSADENDEDKDESSDETESENENENEDVDDNTTVNDQLRMAVQKALGSAAPETDTESVDVDNMNEEEGQRIDEALSSAFKMLRQSKGEITKKEKKNIKLLMEFRIRVLDLVQIYLEKNPSADICIAMILPLFKCLEFAMKDSAQKQLEIKLRSCLQCLTSVKSFTSYDVTINVLADYFKTIINRGNRTQFVFQALGDVISKCGTFIVRCSQKVADSQSSKLKKKMEYVTPIANIYNESLNDFFTKRQCLLPVIFFRDVFQLHWEGNWILLDTIVEKIFDDTIRPFRRHEGLEMINTFYIKLHRDFKNNLSENIDHRLEKIENKFSSKIGSYFSVEHKSLNLERFFCLLTKTLVNIKIYHNTSTCADFMLWEDITKILQSYRKIIKLRNMSEYFKFCNTFNLEKIKNSSCTNVCENNKKEDDDSGNGSNSEKEFSLEKVHDSSNQVNGDVEEIGLVNKKRKKRKNIEISKKESKKLRLMASSEGLQDVSFTKLLGESNMDVNDIKEEPEEDTKIRKEKKKSKMKSNQHNVKKLEIL